MNFYYFILGINPELSISEIKTVLKQKSITFKISETTDKYLIIETKKDLENDTTNLIQTLAGTIKIGQIISQVKDLNYQNFINLLPLTDKKIFFGFSNYSNHKKHPALDLKTHLKNQKQSCRWVNSKDKILSSVVVQKNKLLKENGIEFNIFPTSDKEKILIGKTLEVQDFRKFSELDYGRPKADSLSGMLPPKIAQIMINLAEQKPEATILDPFCGSGTILQQALILGYKNIFGSDNSQKAINDSEDNLKWLTENFNLNFDFNNLQLINVLELAENSDKNYFDAIISEPYLGIPLRGNETTDFILENITNLEDLYTKAFENFNLVLKKAGTIIIIIPEIHINNKIYKLNLDKVLQNKFKIIENWQYSRIGQKVVRNIYKLEKSK